MPHQRSRDQMILQQSSPGKAGPQAELLEAPGSPARYWSLLGSFPAAGYYPEADLGARKSLLCLLFVQLCCF